MVGRFDGEPDDQFAKLEINVEKYAQGPAGADLKAAWHFDRHIIDTKKDSPHVTEDIHPLYHFQFGGARMTKRVQSTKTKLTQRSRGPSMDAVWSLRQDRKFLPPSHRCVPLAED